MDLHELRLQNIVGFKNRTDFFAYVTDFSSAGGVHLNRVFDDGTEDDQPEVIEDITPIKLTEEWVIKLGFVKELPYYIKHKLSITKNMIRDGSGRYNGFYCVLNCEKEPNYIQLMYVHQLQNLYYTLTGTELVLQERGQKV